MKHLFVIIIMLLDFSCITHARRITFLPQHLEIAAEKDAAIKFYFTESSINSNQLKTEMEQNISMLLSDIHTAGNNGQLLDLKNVVMEQGARDRLWALWNVMPFVCRKDVYELECLNDHQGYQVRSIDIELKPHDDSYKQSVYRQLTISLNRNGIITGVRLAMENQEDVNKIMGEGITVTDVAQRLEILKWVEDFKSYYNERDINALKKIYSDDALIITGSVIMQRKMGDFALQLESNVKYTVQSKAQYISNLMNLFRTVKYINVSFEQISVAKHNAKPNIYGVTLRQKWNTDRYSDDGWLFLLWDFSEKDNPQIYVRTWQPNQAVVKDGVFELDDFFIE